MRLAASAALATAALTALALPAVGATCSLTTPDGKYTQDFKALDKVDGTQATLDKNLPGLEFVESGRTSADTNYVAGTGSKANLDTYNFAATPTSTDRAFGSLGSEFATTTFGFHFTNDTGSTLTGLTVAYRGEQWRRGTAAADRLDFSYSTTATSLTAGTYTDADALDFASPALGTADAAGTGKTAGYFRQIGPVTLAVSVPVGGQFFLRWVDFTAPGLNDGLAVDDFGLKLTNAPVAAPEPLAATAGGLLLAATLLPRRRTRPTPGRSGPRL